MHHCGCSSAIVLIIKYEIGSVERKLKKYLTKKIMFVMIYFEGDLKG